MRAIGGADLRKLGNFDGPRPERSHLSGVQVADAGITSDLHETMNSMCRFVREMPPRRYHLWGILHPIMFCTGGCKCASSPG